MDTREPPLMGQPPINTLPLGLLSFLGIKQFGKSPRSLSQDLVACTDLSEFYYSQAETIATSTGPHTTGQTGFTAAHIVPDGEAWLLIGYAIRFNGLGAGESFTAAPALGTRNATAWDPELLHPMQGNFLGSATANSFQVGSDGNMRGRILRSGQSLGTLWGILTSAGTTCIHVARIVRLQI